MLQQEDLVGAIIILMPVGVDGIGFSLPYLTKSGA